MDKCWNELSEDPNERVDLLIGILRPHCKIVYGDLVELSDLSWEDFSQSVEDYLGFDIETILEYYEQWENLEY